MSRKLSFFFSLIAYSPSVCKLCQIRTNLLVWWVDCIHRYNRNWMLRLNRTDSVCTGGVSVLVATLCKWCSHTLALIVIVPIKSNIIDYHFGLYFFVTRISIASVTKSHSYIKECFFHTRTSICDVYITVYFFRRTLVLLRFLWKLSCSDQLIP